MSFNYWDRAWEQAARSFEAPPRRWSTPGELATTLLDPLGTVQTPALDLIDESLVQAADTPDSRLIITMAPQEGKSVRVARDFPIWLLNQNPDLRIVTASYGQLLANRNGLAIRRMVTRHSAELRMSIAADNGSSSNWSLAGRDGGVFSVGIGGGITGRAADLLIIDDPIKSRAEADSKLYRDKVWDWWTDEAAARLAPGAAVVLVLTRWHHDDLAGRLLNEEGSRWVLRNIPARADHNPEKGETDVLGREPGEYMQSARKRSREQWIMREMTAGTRTWNAQYQGRPSPDTGNLFPVDGWGRYDTPLWVARRDGAHIVPEANTDPSIEIVQSWDFAFKDTKSSDYVVGQVWMRRGHTAYLLDQVRRKAGFSESVRMILDLTARWPQAISKLVEDKANGPAILNALKAKVGGLIPVEPEGSKYARASAVTPFVEAKNVLLPDPTTVPDTAWVVALTDEARDFPSATHDDTVDAMSQAVHRLLLVPILMGEDVYDADDLLPDLDAELDWTTSY